jgi:hypothetical protein
MEDVQPRLAEHKHKPLWWKGRERLPVDILGQDRSENSFPWLMDSNHALLPLPAARRLAATGPLTSRSIDPSIYEARALAAGLAFCFSAAIRVFAAGPEDAGFCPVISRPSVTT